jgi:hypothetical protein
MLAVLLSLAALAALQGCGGETEPFVQPDGDSGTRESVLVTEEPSVQETERPPEPTAREPRIRAAAAQPSSTRPAATARAAEPTPTTEPQPEEPASLAGLPACAGTDCDCADFATHAEAQAFYQSQGPGDPHRLDRDSDGLACETLP